MLTLRGNFQEDSHTMTEVFVIRNQLGHYWGKSKTWLDGTEARAVMRTRHRDEAVNTLVELSAKDFELRGDVVSAETTERGEPIIEASQIPLPMSAEPESTAAEIAEAAATEPEQAAAEAQENRDSKAAGETAEAPGTTDASLLSKA
jgi:hypothetical protein